MRERAFHPDSVESILVLRLYFIGDVLLSTPVFEALKRRFRRASLTVLVKSRAAEVLRGNPFVDDVIVYDDVPRYHSPVWLLGLAKELRRRRFSLAVDLTGDHRSSWLMLASDPGFRVGFNHSGMGFLLDRRIDYEASGHVVDHLLSAVAPLGAEVGDAMPRIYLTSSERESCRQLLAEAGLSDGEGLLVISPGANWEHRRWRTERYGEVAAHVRSAFGLQTVVVGAPDDTALADEVVAHSGGAALSLAGRTGLRGLAALAERASVFLGSDSGPTHLAAAAGTPTVALFGPNTPTRFAPRGAPTIVLWHEFDCSPCRQKRCVRPDSDCMDAITAAEVTAALDELLAEGGAR